MFRNFLLVCFLLPIISGKRASRITHGNAVSRQQFENSFPFLVAIHNCIAKNKCLICTGSLLTPTKVLTAGHCYCFNFISREIIYNTTHAAHGQRVEVKRIDNKFDCSHIIYSSYGHRDSIINDVAVVTLEQPINNITTIGLKCDDVPIGQTVELIGFGDDENGEYERLIHGSRRLVKCTSNCPSCYCVRTNSTKTLTGTGSGDSGGPLLLPSEEKFLQIGVTAGFAPLAGGKNAPKIYYWGKLGPLCDWIKEKVENQ